MLVYHYDPNTGVYTNVSSEADEDPMEPGHFLIPANATELIPPSPSNPKKQWPVFRDGAWLIEDMPIPPAIHTNIKEAPKNGMWPRMSIKETLKGGVT